MGKKNFGSKNVKDWNKIFVKFIKINYKYNKIE